MKNDNLFNMYIGLVVIFKKLSLHYNNVIKTQCRFIKFTYRNSDKQLTSNSY